MFFYDLGKPQKSSIFSVFPLVVAGPLKRTFFAASHTSSVFDAVW